MRKLETSVSQEWMIMSGWEIVCSIWCIMEVKGVMSVGLKEDQREKKLDSRKSLGLPGLVNHINMLILFLSAL